MSQSLSRVLVHITFSTKNRIKFIDPAIKEDLYKYLGAICKQLECTPIIVGGHRDHIHILCILSKKITQISLLEEIKKSSSKWIKTKGNQYMGFYWQGGYAIFSVNSKDAEIVKKYIQNQEDRHRKITFKEELLALLKEHNIQYDERYLWE